jgi:epoxyqueuosine reductase
MIIEEILKTYLIPAEQYIYGFADLRELIPDTFGDLEYAISIGRKLDDRIIDPVKDGPDLEYYTHYKEINKELSDLALRVCQDLRSNGIKCMKTEPTVSTLEIDTTYRDTLRTELSHKMAATRAGLGWIGKTDLFISRKFGPRVRLVTILLSTPVKSKLTPIDKSLCGKCDICVIKCPARAANGILWDIRTDRDEFFDAQKCRDKCTETGRVALKMDIRICGICVAVCPIGRSLRKE